MEETLRSVVASRLVSYRKRAKLTQAELAEKFSVMTIPTFMLFKKGVAVDKIIGAMPKEALADFAKK